MRVRIYSVYLTHSTDEVSLPVNLTLIFVVAFYRCQFRNSLNTTGFYACAGRTAFTAKACGSSTAAVILMADLL